MACRCSDTTETNDCLCAYVVDAPVLASYNLQIVSYQCPPPTHTQLLSALLYAQSMLSAYKGAAHVSSVSNKAVCVCVCVQGVRSQDLLTFVLGHSLRNCMR